MSYPMSSNGQQPFDLSAARAMQLLSPRPALTKAEGREAKETVKTGGLCTFCAGIHAGLSSPACPRLASGKVNGDGTVVEFTYWRDGEWDTSRIIFAADIEDAEESEGEEKSSE